VNVLVSIFASDILPVFVVAGVGFALARFLNASVKTLAHIVFYALVPCFVFRLLVTSNIVGPQFAKMALMAVLVAAAMGLIARLVAVPLRLSRPELSAFLLAVIFSNGGNYGLPVVLFAFGPEALSYGTVYFVVSALMTYTVGVFLAAAGRGGVLRAAGGVLRVPAFYGVTAAVLVVATGLRLPLLVMRPISLLSEAALPMMMLVLGMQLERATIPERPKVVLIAVSLSLMVAPLVALGLAALLGITGTARQAGVALASMPVAVVTTILALEFEAAPAIVTAAVFLSTILSPFTLTPLIAYLR
jgi:predicted permease